MGSPLRKLLLALGCLGLLLCVGKPAAASPVTYNIVFGASGFDKPGGPVGLVLGDLDITLDPTLGNGFGTTVTVHNLNISVANPFWATLTGGILLIGGVDNGPLDVAAGTNDFLLALSGFNSASPSFGTFSYSQIGAPAVYNASTGQVFITQVAATPIPAALPLFISALGGLGYIGWRRRKSPAA